MDQQPKTATSFRELLNKYKVGDVIIYFDLFILFGVLIGVATNKNYWNDGFQKMAYQTPYTLNTILSQWLVTFAGFWVALVITIMKTWGFVFRRDRFAWSFFFSGLILLASMTFIALLARLDFLLACPSDKGISIVIGNKMIFSLLGYFVPLAIFTLSLFLLTRNESAIKNT